MVRIHKLKALVEVVAKGERRTHLELMLTSLRRGRWVEKIDCENLTITN